MVLLLGVFGGDLYRERKNITTSERKDKVMKDHHTPKPAKKVPYLLKSRTIDTQTFQ